MLRLAFGRVLLQTSKLSLLLAILAPATLPLKHSDQTSLWLSRIITLKMSTSTESWKNTSDDGNPDAETPELNFSITRNQSNKTPNTETSGVSSFHTEKQPHIENEASVVANAKDDDGGTPRFTAAVDQAEVITAAMAKSPDSTKRRPSEHKESVPSESQVTDAVYESRELSQRIPATARDHIIDKIRAELIRSSLPAQEEAIRRARSAAIGTEHNRAKTSVGGSVRAELIRSSLPAQKKAIRRARSAAIGTEHNRAKTNVGRSAAAKLLELDFLLSDEGVTTERCSSIKGSSLRDLKQGLAESASPSSKLMRKGHFLDTATSANSGLSNNKYASSTARAGRSSRARRLAVTLKSLSITSMPDFLDIVEQFRMDNIRDQRLMLLSLMRSLRSSGYKARYRAIVRGKIPLPGFVLDAEGKIWHQLATPRFVVLCEHKSSVPANHSVDAGVGPQDRGYARFSELLGLSVNSIRFTSAGLRPARRANTHYHSSIHSIVALQTIREMLHWRYVFRAFLSEHPIGTTCRLDGMELFYVAEHARLSYNNETDPDVYWLDPCNWNDLSHYGLGLVAWVNIPVFSFYDPAQLLRTVDVTKCNSADWARISLQFGGGRSREQAIVFVDLIRFMVIRHHVPAAAEPSLLCANEFLDRAVAIPELETCLPEILNVQNKYARGYDIDTGAVTRVDLLGGNGVMTINGSTSPSIQSGSVGHSSRDFVDTMPVSSGVCFRGLPHARDRRVVMSMRTNPISGTEWKVPERIESQVKFTIERDKYKLCVVDGTVSCKRVGVLERLKNEVRGVTQVQIPFLSVQREPSRSNTLEASGSVAISNALSCAYGEEACLQMLGWLHRGVVNVSPQCTASSFVPRSCHVGDIVVNQRLGYEICRRMMFGRQGHELYWLPGDGLPCFRVTDCPNGTYKVTEVDKLPPGVELCTAEINKDFA